MDVEVISNARIRSNATSIRGIISDDILASFCAEGHTKSAQRTGRSNVTNGIIDETKGLKIGQIAENMPFAITAGKDEFTGGLADNHDITIQSSIAASPNRNGVGGGAVGKRGRGNTLVVGAANSRGPGDSVLELNQLSLAADRQKN